MVVQVSAQFLLIQIIRKWIKTQQHINSDKTIEFDTPCYLKMKG
jgi:hypothetical protein